MNKLITDLFRGCLIHNIQLNKANYKMQNHNIIYIIFEYWKFKFPSRDFNISSYYSDLRLYTYYFSICLLLRIFYTLISLIGDADSKNPFWYFQFEKKIHEKFEHKTENYLDKCIINPCDSIFPYNISCFRLKNVCEPDYAYYETDFKLGFIQAYEILKLENKILGESLFVLKKLYGNNFGRIIWFLLSTEIKNELPESSKKRKQNH